ncbi:SDR family NAD(P)-dependent oxidoreductase [Microbacterium oleivorans]|uniref:SDR family NAD(P)-dependent oxidoreductase n=1 Tax=Microbacterium oleivorans TaxID=273677 RepID=UPI0009ED9437|nr:SDR family NAD(P)-dependent oxidoreductase [Microbacterium oleivorans]
MSQRARLRNATVVVTGATSGVGRGTALALADRGARVVLAARRDTGRGVPLTSRRGPVRTREAA